MSGLRAKQKALRHSRILQTAAALFRDKGYDAVKMDMIANAADVSIGTIYNYYQNKGDLLVAIVALEVGEVLASGEKLIAKPIGNAVKAIDALIANYIGHSLVYLDKPMWRHAMAISIQQPNSPFGLAYSAQDVALAKQTCALIKSLQKLGHIRVDIDATALGELVFNNTNMMFTVFVKSDAMTVKQLRATIRRQLRNFRTGAGHLTGGRPIWLFCFPHPQPSLCPSKVRNCSILCIESSA
jgi:AcrR family transcriptional regulator